VLFLFGKYVSYRYI